MRDEAARDGMRRVIAELLGGPEEIEEEVLGHVEEGMRRHLVLGKGPEEAMAAALADLGSMAPLRRAVHPGTARTIVETLERDGILESLARLLGGR